MCLSRSAGCWLSCTKFRSPSSTTIRSFIKNLQNDVNQYVQTSSNSAAIVPNAAVYGPASPFLTSIWGLSASASSEANRLEGDAHDAMNQADRSAVVGAFKRALELDPKFTRAWLELTIAYMTFRQSDSALDAVRKAIDSDPKQLVARKAYAFVLKTLRRPDAELDAWREALKIAPDDPEANSELGALLMQQKRYADAVPYLETAAKSDNSPVAQTRLGSAYLRRGEIERGTGILQKVAEAHSNPEMLNDVAYYFAEASANLPKALEYAQRAVDGQEKESHDVGLSNLLLSDLACTQKIAMFWDTLGWVHFRLGHLEQAESYLHAAWLLSQGGRGGRSSRPSLRAAEKSREGHPHVSLGSGHT
jgi:Tfp pilus assembly protein PilF